MKRRFFQALESFSTNFPEPWKTGADFFQGLEKMNHVDSRPRRACPAGAKVLWLGG
jgi:hypothetical protein